MILKLHRRSGTPIWVNSEHVVTFGAEREVANPSLSVITLRHNQTIHVRETPAEILAMLGLPFLAVEDRLPHGLDRDITSDEALERR